MPTHYLKSGNIRTYNTRIVDDGNVVCVWLYQTCIFQWNKSSRICTINTGGRNTPTTIRRINECLNHYGFPGKVCKAHFTNFHSIEMIKP